MFNCIWEIERFYKALYECKSSLFIWPTGSPLQAGHSEQAGIRGRGALKKQKLKLAHLVLRTEKLLHKEAL